MNVFSITCGLSLPFNKPNADFKISECVTLKKVCKLIDKQNENGFIFLGIQAVGFSLKHRPMSNDGRKQPINPRVICERK